MPSKKGFPTKPSLQKKLALSMVAAGVAIFALELTVRVYRSAVFSLEPLGLERPHRQEAAGYLQYDETLGHHPRPGEFVHDDGWAITINESRFRFSAKSSSASGPPILAVGDSFTFGDEVDDDETWPAYLREELRRPILNGGVSAYGIDQAVLRAERLIPEWKPSLVILALVSGDVDRCEWSYFSGAWRPYFELENDRLVLCNQPVPTAPRSVSTFRSLMGYSYLAHAVFRRVAPDWWYLNRNKVEHDDGERVTSALIARLSRFAAENQTRLLIVILCDSDLDVAHVPAVLEAGRRHNVPILDLSQEIIQLARSSADPAEVFRPKRHLTPQSNEWVANRIARFLEQRDW
jgi:hypothetical protein